jgi:1-pyrroline-5-carboxylate dehydrogenase
MTGEATATDTQNVVEAALAAGRAWPDLSFNDRAAIFLRAVDLLSGPYRDTLNAATMLGQSKTVQQTEIDAICELADF